MKWEINSLKTEQEQLLKRSEKRLHIYGAVLILIAILIMTLLFWGISIKFDHDKVVHHENLSTSKEIPDTCLVFRDKEEKIIYIRRLK